MTQTTPRAAWQIKAEERRAAADAKLHRRSRAGLIAVVIFIIAALLGGILSLFT